MKKESEGGDTVRISEFANCSAFRTTHFCVCLCVCESFFDKDSSLGCTSESGVHKINTGREWESIACPLFALYIHCFPFFGQILKLNEYTELESSGWHIFCMLQAKLSAAIRIYIAHSWQIYSELCSLLSLRMNCVLACNFIQTYFPPCSILLLLPSAVFLSC